MKVVFKIKGGNEVVTYKDIKEITIAELLAIKKLLESENGLPIEMNIEN